MKSSFLQILQQTHASKKSLFVLSVANNKAKQKQTKQNKQKQQKNNNNKTKQKKNTKNNNTCLILTIQ